MSKTNASKGVVITGAVVLVLALFILFFVILFFYLNRPVLDNLIAGINTLLTLKLP